MKPYICSILFLITTNFSFAQSKELVLKDNYEIDENTTLDIDIDNASIVFEESKDNKVYFNYSILFNQDSEDIKYRVFKGINAKSSKVNNSIKLHVKNTMYLGELHVLDVDLNTYKKHIKALFRRKKQNEFLYKTKDSVVKEINFSLGTDSNDYFKKLKLENPNKDYGKSYRKFKQHFIVKVPKNIKIKIKALHSRIHFTYDVHNQLEVSSFKTYYKFKKLINKHNSFKLMNGLFQVEKILGGNFKLTDIYKARIGAIINTNLHTETSKIQIGEVGKNVSVTDFDSKYHIYNFSNSFIKFKYLGDYSEVNLYKVKEANYTMDVFGFNTALNMNGNKTIFGDSKDKKRTKILEKKPKNNSLNKTEIELKNGILNIK